MNFSFFKQNTGPSPDATASLVHRLAEQIIREVNRHGARAFRIKVFNKSDVLKPFDQAFIEIEENAALPVQTRSQDMLVGLAISSDKDGTPMMYIPAGLLLPLINTFAGQTSKKNNRRCFTVIGKTSEGDRYFDIKVILEDDATLSIEFDEIL